jgi:hypothetical protein
MSRQFQTTRLDGRSNSQVIIDLVKADEPGTIYTYDVLRTALNEKSTKSYDVSEAQAAVRNANSRLLREQSRVLRCVIRTGYKLALANEHAPLALDRRRRGNRQYQRGLELLENVRLEELDENARNLHVGHMMITKAVIEHLGALTKRQAASDEIIKKLAERQDQTDQTMKRLQEQMLERERKKKDKI